MIEEKRDAESLKQHEMPKRWKVHISQLEIVTMLEEACDPFLQIIVGGTHYVSLQGKSKLEVDRDQEDWRRHTVLALRGKGSNHPDRCT